MKSYPSGSAYKARMSKQYIPSYCECEHLIYFHQKYKILPRGACSDCDCQEYKRKCRHEWDWNTAYKPNVNSVRQNCKCKKCGQDINEDQIYYPPLFFK